MKSKAEKEAAVAHKRGMQASLALKVGVVAGACVHVCGWMQASLALKVGVGGKCVLVCVCGCESLWRSYLAWWQVRACVCGGGWF